MDKVTGILAANPTVLAIVNIVALIGGALLIFNAIRTIWRFVQTAYRTSIRTALERAKARSVQTVEFCAEDLPYFVARLAHSACICLAATVGLVISVIYGKLEGADKYWMPQTFWQAIWVANSFIYILLFAIAVVGTVNLAREVARIRLRVITMGRAKKSPAPRVGGMDREGTE